MTDFFCAICGKINTILTIFAATLLCKECIDKVKIEAKTNQEASSVSKVIVKQSMEDIYD